MNTNWVTDSVVSQVSTGGAERVALCLDGDERLTYRELHDLSLTWANAMRRCGVRPGDRVGMLLFNCLEYHALYLAAARIGAITVRLNFRLTPSELQFMLSDSGCELVLVHASLLDRIEPIRADTAIRHCVVLEDVATPTPTWALTSDAFVSGIEPIPITDYEPSGDDGMALLYTSGTTGLPKGALWTHGNTVSIGAIQTMKWGFGKHTVTLTPGPTYHAGGFEALLLPTLLSHGTAVFLSSTGFSVERLLEVICAEQVTDALVYSFMLYDFLRVPDIGDRVPASLRRIYCGGDTIMPWVGEEMRRVLPGVELTQLYGLSEGGAVATALDHADCVEQPGSIGRPMPLTEARVVDPAGAMVAPGEVGELQVRSPAVCDGYWRRPESNRETFVDGWARTGDLATVNAQGFVFLAGRAKDMIRSGGENIYPAEVEAVLTDHPGLGDAAVVAVPDEKYNEVGCAVIVERASGAVSDEDLRAHCRKRLAGYKIPKYFVRVTELPRNGAGKVLKYQLREQYAQIRT
jgi:fatty-acyl-CoA synthase